MNYLRYAAKAVFAAVTTLIGQLTLIVTGDMSLSDVTAAQWLVVALVTIVVTGGVFGLENKTLPIEGLDR